MRKASTFIIAIAFVWIGMVLGISFIAAPLKFQAPGVTTLIGVGIGNIVFHALNKIEIVFLVVLLISNFISDRHRFNIIIILALGLLLVLQIGWLMPKLDTRVALIQRGITPPPSELHIYYIIGEVIKLILLLSIGIKNIKLLSCQTQNTPDIKL